MGLATFGESLLSVSKKHCIKAEPGKFVNAALKA